MASQRDKLRSTVSPPAIQKTQSQLSSKSPLTKKQKKKSPEDNTSTDTMEMFLKFEKAIHVQTELITSQIADFEKRITVKMDTDVAELKSSMEGLNARMSMLESKQTEIEPLKEENRKLKQQIQKLGEEIKAVSIHMDAYKEEQKQKETICDALLHGVPLLPTENLLLIFTQLSPPIVIKFFSQHDKLLVLRSIANHRKITNKQLHLDDLGLGNVKATLKSNVYLHESLTIKNRSLLQQALKAKRDKKLFSVFTIRGLVYIKKSKDEDAKLFQSTDDLPDSATMTQTTTNTATEDD
ncbi:uncharacterized protein LOC129943925 [Eupeodes corollae]|uniref:uncharacterized protein LOC129943925 n=1 Tax=Eupeodes corollae TaxID=290404 RepID=UPI00249133D3|nr:uncharacterized protein LOC129943925 [Eupeodes corollae]